MFAAASLSDALQDLARDYERRTGDVIVFNFAGSSLLARQIALGAPADLFLSADEEKVRGLGRLVKRQAVVLSNTLVIVSNASIDEPADLIGKSVALAEEHVPAGIYAREWLRRVGLWDRVAPKVIPTANVRGALAAVTSGNVDAAIVYATDAPHARVAYRITRNDGPRIAYPFALLTDAKPAARFYDYLRSPAAMRVFARYGFLKP